MDLNPERYTVTASTVAIVPFHEFPTQNRKPASTDCEQSMKRLIAGRFTFGLVTLASSAVSVVARALSTPPALRVLAPTLVVRFHWVRLQPSIIPPAK